MEPIEEMVALDYLGSRPDACFEIKSPDAVARAGYYPTRSCVRYDPERNAYTVSIEEFVHRDAAAALPVTESDEEADS